MKNVGRTDELCLRRCLEGSGSGTRRGSGSGRPPASARGTPPGSANGSRPGSASGSWKKSRRGQIFNSGRIPIHPSVLPAKETHIIFQPVFFEEKALELFDKGPKANSGPLSPYNEELFAVLSSRRMAMACLNSAQFQLICQKRYIFWKVRK